MQYLNKEQIYLDWYDVNRLAKDVALQVEQSAEQPFDRIVGIGRGGLIPAALVAYYYGLSTDRHPLILSLDVTSYEGENKGQFAMHGDPRTIQAEGLRTLIVDDIADSGHTLSAIKGLLVLAHTAVLVYKAQSIVVPDFHGLKDEEADKFWYVFPWERDNNHSGPGTHSSGARS